MKRREWCLRSQLLAVRADIILPFAFLFVIFAATVPGYSDSTTHQVNTPPTLALDYAGASAID
jgi:hypothetical protein